MTIRRVFAVLAVAGAAGGVTLLLVGDRFGWWARFEQGLADRFDERTPIRDETPGGAS